MKTLVPQKADDLFASKDRSTAPEEFVRLFLAKEENAQRLETKTGTPLILTYYTFFHSFPS